MLEVKTAISERIPLMSLSARNGANYLILLLSQTQLGVFSFVFASLLYAWRLQDFLRDYKTKENSA